MDGLGVADAGNDVLALRVDKEVAVKLLGAVGGVASERHAGCRGFALVAKYHDLDVHRGTEVIGDAVLLAIQAGALVEPASENGLDGKAQLQGGIGRELDGTGASDQLGMIGRGDVLAENALERGYELTKVLG